MSNLDQAWTYYLEVNGSIHCINCKCCKSEEY